MTPQVRGLLTALRDCLDLPTAIYDDEEKRYRELNTRVNMLLGAIRSTLDNPSSVDMIALTQTARQFAGRPLGYEPYQSEVPA